MTCRSPCVLFVGAAVCGGPTRRMSHRSAAVAADDARDAAARGRGLVLRSERYFAEQDKPRPYNRSLEL